MAKICTFLFFLGALTKVKECPKQEGGLQERCNIISCATMAEIQHFHRTRVRDFRSQMQHHLRQQISFFQKITAKLENALQKYDDDNGDPGLWHIQEQGATAK